jgi:HPt (histidine-containing phosphotransfer) domain-containing protein
MDTVPDQPNPTSAFLTRLWERNTPILLDRLRTLDDAADAAGNGALDDSLRTAALAQAHNLAGSLGMFGYPKGTDIAREIEVALETPDALSPDLLSELTKTLRATLFPTP